MIDLYRESSLCNLHTKNCSKETWPKDQKRLYEPVPEIFKPPEEWEPIRLMPPCCERYVRQIIFYIADLFEEHGIPYWMDFGTLLGAMRYANIGGRLIPYDTDGDFCLFMKDRQRVLALKERILSDGFCLVEHNYKRIEDIKLHGGTVLRICRSELNRNQIDLFFWDRDPEWNLLVSDGLNVDKSFPDWYVNELIPVPLYGKPIMAPREPEIFLAMRFGQKWKTPMDKKVVGHHARECHELGLSFARLVGWNKTVRML